MSESATTEERRAVGMMALWGWVLLGYQALEVILN